MRFDSFWQLAVLAPVLACSLLLTRRLYRLLRNYGEARKLGLPIIIAPFTAQDPVWVLARPWLGSFIHLPFGLGKWIRYSSLGWQLEDKGDVHRTLGGAFVIVSPNRTEISIADPAAAVSILTHYKQWLKPEEIYSAFLVFGPNVNVVNREDWQRHRKITGTAFRERNYVTVWKESLKQGNACMELLQKEKAGRCTFLDVQDNMTLIAIHVLSAASLGHNYEFGSGMQRIEPGHKMSYWTASATVLRDLLSTILLRTFQVPYWLLPARFKNVKDAFADFRLYLEESVKHHKEINSEKESGAYLISALVQANEKARVESKVLGNRASYLTEEELYGNLFMFNIAGLETTSTSLIIAMGYLAVRPELQDWIREEVDTVFNGGNEITYESFDQLPRCLAILYELLRLHSAVPLQIRYSDTPQVLDLPYYGRSVTVPRSTWVSMDFYSIHLDERYWPNAKTFMPKRWITSSEASPSPFKETLIPEPVAGKSSSMNTPGYLAWVTGPRVCPGKKFSQVEFVAVIATIVHKYKVLPLPTNPGQSRELAAKDIQWQLDNTYFNLSPKLKKPEAIGVEFVRRS